MKTQGHMSVRWTMVMLMCSAVAITYTMRVNMSVAAEQMATELGWGEKDKGYMFGIFYVGYALGQVPSVLIAADRPKMVLGMGTLCPAILTIFMPLACRYSFNVGLVLRGLTGLFASSIFPAIFTFFNHWVPRDEKSLMIATTMSGMYIGEVIGFSVSGMVCVTDIELPAVAMLFGKNVGRWPGVFYGFGMMALMYVPIWFAFAWDTPAQCPYITPDEMKLLLTETTSAIALARSKEASDPESQVLLEPEDGLRKRGMGVGTAITEHYYSTPGKGLGGAGAGAGPDASHSPGGVADLSEPHNDGGVDLRTIPWSRFFRYRLQSQRAE